MLPFALVDASDSRPDDVTPRDRSGHGTAIAMIAAGEHVAGPLATISGIAPKAFLFGVTNPVMVQGAVFSGITITEGFDRAPREVVKTGDWVRVDPPRRLIEVLERA